MPRANGMTERAREALHDAEDVGQRVMSRGAERARRAGKGLQNVAEDVLDTADTTRHNLEAAIANRPLMSVAVAAGVGFLLARIWR